MSLRQWIQHLEPREQRLLRLLWLVFAVLLLLLVPAGLLGLLGSRRAHNTELAGAIKAVQLGREKVARREAERARVLARYARPAPPLPGWLEQLGKEQKLEIPESQPQAPVPHGTDYEEKPTKIVLRRVGMYPLAKFMEAIERSGHPVVISRLSIRKRAAEADSYDVEMVVSAFERKVKERLPPAASEAASHSGPAESPGDEEP